QVAAALPATAQGIRVSGDQDRMVHTVAVCGGAGDAYLGAAHASGADVYVTADLRHHRAEEARAELGAPALIDAAHWASEWPWLPVAAGGLTPIRAGGWRPSSAPASPTRGPLGWAQPKPEEHR